MPSLLVRNLSEAAYQALCVRAAKNNRSVEAEALLILEGALLPEKQIKLGSAIAALFAENGLDLNIERNKTPAHPIKLD